MGLAERLSQKGWSKAEIEHALSHLKLAERQKSSEHRAVEAMIYWLNMGILVAANIGISWFLFPFLSQLPHTLSVMIAAVLGVIWGVLFGHLGHEIAKLAPHRHSVVLFAASLTVLFTALVVGSYSIVLSIVFTMAFVLYYTYLWWRHAN